MLPDAGSVRRWATGDPASDEVLRVCGRERGGGPARAASSTVLGAATCEVVVIPLRAPADSGVWPGAPTTGDGIARSGPGLLCLCTTRFGVGRRRHRIPRGGRGWIHRAAGRA